MSYTSITCLTFLVFCTKCFFSHRRRNIQGSNDSIFKWRNFPICMLPLDTNLGRNIFIPLWKVVYFFCCFFVLNEPLNFVTFSRSQWIFFPIYGALHAYSKRCLHYSRTHVLIVVFTLVFIICICWTHEWRHLTKILLITLNSIHIHFMERNGNDNVNRHFPPFNSIENNITFQP